MATMRPLAPGKVDIRDRASTHYTYIDLLSAKPSRQKTLHDAWYFDCACTRCASDEEHALTAVKCPTCAEDVVLFGADSKKDTNTQSVVCGHCGVRSTLPFASAVPTITVAIAILTMVGISTPSSDRMTLAVHCRS